MVNVAYTFDDYSWAGRAGGAGGTIWADWIQGRTNDPQETPGTPLKHLCIGQGLGQTIV